MQCLFRSIVLGLAKQNPKLKAGVKAKLFCSIKTNFMQVWHFVHFHRSHPMSDHARINSEDSKKLFYSKAVSRDKMLDNVARVKFFVICLGNAANGF